MTRLYISGNAVDQNQIPVVGAQVYVRANGVLATLQNAAGDDLPNPLITIADGFFEAYSASTGQHTLEYYWGGRLRRIDTVSDADIVQAAAQAALAAVGADSYPNTTAGLAGTALGETFFTVSGGVGTIYRHDAGPTATQISKFIVDPQGSGGSALIGHVASGTGAVTRDVQDKLRETVSVKDFGATGNGTTDDTAAITAAEAASGKKYAPAGTYDTTLAAVDLDGTYWGEGQIRDVANNKRAPWFSAVKAAPSSLGNHDSIETAFNGDLARNQIAMEHRITGAATLGQPTTGYLYRPEAMPIYGYLYNGSGWNNATNSNVGRTGVAFQRVVTYQAGQGDAVCYNASAFVTGTKAGSTSFLANPAAVLFNGDIEAGAAGTYLNAGEFIMVDGGFDVAAVGWVVNGVRTVATGAKSAYWAGFRAQSQGSAFMDQAFGAAGKFNVFADATPVELNTTKALIAAKSGDRVYMDAATSNGFYATSLGSAYYEYRSDLLAFNFVVQNTSVLQVGSDRTTFIMPPRLPTVTVAALPAASTRSGMEYYVSDANATTRLATVAGGGSSFVKVFSNGTNWIIA